MTLSTTSRAVLSPLRKTFISSQLPMVYCTFQVSISKLLMYWSMLGKQNVRRSSDAWATSCFIELVNCALNWAKKLM